jgi:hypothetical protein
MSIASLKRRMDRAEIALKLRHQQTSSVLDAIRTDPCSLMTRAQQSPDPWQAELLRGQDQRVIILASRQCGKSTVSAALAIRAAVMQANAPVLLLSPSLRQSGELFKKIVSIYDAIGRPVPVARETALQLELTNGSRIVSLPGAEGTVRGFSGVALLIIDEASRVSDALYYAVRPMLAVSNGQLVALSTPFGQRGWFFDEWTSQGANARASPRSSWPKSGARSATAGIARSTNANSTRRSTRSSRKPISWRLSPTRCRRCS